MDFYSNQTMLSWEVKRRMADLRRDTAVAPAPEFGFGARVADSIAYAFRAVADTGCATSHRPRATTG